MRAFLLVFLFNLFTGQAIAQNLVKNPSLEKFKNGVIGFRRVSGTPDVASKDYKITQYPPYYNSYQADLPTRSVSNIRFGDVCLCQWFSATSSELTQIELLKPLKKNREYVVSLYTIKASVIEPPIKEITVHFTRKRLQSTREVYGFPQHELTGESIPYLSLTSSTEPVLKSQDHWVKVSGVYKAKGGERYLTVGNFIGANKEALEAMNPVKVNTTRKKNAKIKGTYYCYDNISVISKEEATEEEELMVMGESKPEIKEHRSLFSIGDTITLGDINFTTGSHQILPVAHPILDSLATFMSFRPEVAVHVQGHTDNVGSEEDNLNLSIRRAQGVKEYLINQGISSDRITFRGHGESVPKVENDTVEKRAVNRRVEIEIRRK